MKIGIEFLSSMKIVRGTAMYTGGTNYAKGIVKTLCDSDESNKFSIVLFVHNKFKITEKDCSLGINEKCEIRYIEDLEDGNYSDLKIMFFPQVNGLTLLGIPKIKRNNPNLKICATLHDRQHNFCCFDWNDRFYYAGFRRSGVFDFWKYFLKKITFAVLYGNCVKHIDSVFTVSNYSMQRLMHKNIRNIKYFIQKNTMDEFNVFRECENYALFVGGDRPEKNLFRTLQAFCLFKKKTKSELGLKITGVSEKTKCNLLKSKKINCVIVSKSVEFLPYVSYQKLAELYSGCRYVIFTSKGEGYGLPVREAMSYGKTVLASRISSIPEVAGAALYYVDPFDIDSICEGFQFFEDERNLARFQRYVLKRNGIMEEMARQDTQILIDEILDIARSS